MSIPSVVDIASRQARSRAILKYYPNVSEEELGELLHWFREEASPLEVGQIASDPDLAKPYQRLKTDHLDRLRGADLVRAAIVIMLLGAAIIALILTRVT